MSGNRNRHRRVVALVIASCVVSLGALVASGCTGEARSDLAREAFIKAVNLKCKLTKSEYSLAWDVADQLGADERGRELAVAARRRSDELLAEIDRLDGPRDVTSEVQDLFRKASDTAQEAADGRIDPAEARARLEELRQEARDRGLGECVSI